MRMEVIAIFYLKSVGIINVSCSRIQSSDASEAPTCRHSWGKCWARVYTCNPKDFIIAKRKTLTIRWSKECRATVLPAKSDSDFIFCLYKVIRD